MSAPTTLRVRSGCDLANIRTSGRRLLRPCTFEGEGLHSGSRARVHVEPAPSGWTVVVGAEQRNFAELQVVDTHRMTRVEPTCRSFSIATVEHLFGAVAGCRLGPLRVRVEPSGQLEIPALDGGAATFARELIAASEPAEVSALAPLARSTFRIGPSAYCISPAASRRLEVELDYGQLHGQLPHRYVWLESETAPFADEIAPARTFAFAEWLPALRRAGLASGASLDNALVFAPGGQGDVLNPKGALWNDEPHRHKILDLLGDLALLGAPLIAAVEAVQPGHYSNNAFARWLRRPPLDDTATGAQHPQSAPLPQKREP